MYAMSCHVMSCHVMSCHVIVWYGMHVLGMITNERILLSNGIDLKRLSMVKLLKSQIGDAFMCAKPHG